MKIYVDFDDCLCETAKAFSSLNSKGSTDELPLAVPRKEMIYFCLKRRKRRYHDEGGNSYVRLYILQNHQRGDPVQEDL